MELSHWHTAAKATVSVACSSRKSDGNDGSNIMSDKCDVNINANVPVSKGFLKYQQKHSCNRVYTIVALMKRV